MGDTHAPHTHCKSISNAMQDVWKMEEVYLLKFVRVFIRERWDSHSGLMSIPHLNLMMYLNKVVLQ